MILKMNKKNKIRYQNNVAMGLYYLLIEDYKVTVTNEENIVVWNKKFEKKILNIKLQEGNFSSICEQIIIKFDDTSYLVYSTQGSLLFESNVNNSYFKNYYEESPARVLKSYDRKPGLYQVRCNVYNIVDSYQLFDTRGTCIYDGDGSMIDFKVAILSNELLQIKTYDQVEIVNIEVKLLEDETKIFAIGDSTLANQQLPMWSWVQLLQTRTNKPVINLAISGRSTKSFNDEGRYFYLWKHIKSGDKLIIGFGHNDQKLNFFGTSVDDYISNIKNIIDECIIRGVEAIVVTPIPRREFIDKELVETLEPYLSALKANFDRYLVDNNYYTKELINSLGVEESKRVYVHSKSMKVIDNTHTSYLGASEICNLFITNYNL